MARSTDARRARAAEIARAAVEPMSRQGVHNVRLQDVGAGLGMTGAHLLYYFSSKTDLFLASLQVVEHDLHARARDAFAELPDARSRWEWLLEAGAPHGLGDSGLLLWLEAWAEAVHTPEVLDVVTELERQWQALLAEVLQHGVARGELPHDLDVPTVVEGVAALLDGLTIRVVVGHRPVDHDQAMRVLDLFTRPLLPWRDHTSQGQAS